MSEIMHIYQLIYYSIASPSLNRNEIPNILKISQENNSKNEITGCMVYYNDAFIQILEGGQEVVESLYSKIEQDKRHYNVNLIYNEIRQERLFSNWSMAFVDLDKNGEVDKGDVTFRKNFIAISNQAGNSTVAGQLFWDIANQLVND